MQKTNNIKMICLAGVMAALYVCLDFLAVSVSAPFGGTLKISISGLPVIIVAIFCGLGGARRQALSVLLSGNSSPTVSAQQRFFGYYLPLFAVSP